MAEVHWTPKGWRCDKRGEHLRRARWMDYRSPSIQLLTMVTTERLPLFGELRGEEIILTPLGQKVADEILRIHDRLPKHLGQYVRWFKLQCDDACRALGVVPPSKGICLFAKEYHDSILKGKNQLKHMIAYIKDNPRRLALKRAHRDLFRIRQNERILCLHPPFEILPIPLFRIKQETHS